MSNDEVDVERSRRRLLAGSMALAVTLATGLRARAGSAALPEVTVYKSPT